MPVKLRDQDGYYSREVVIGGSRFKIRELDDEILDQVMEIEAQMAELLKQVGLSPAAALEVMQLRESGEARPQAMEALAKLAEAPPDLARRLRLLQRQRRDVIVRNGLVDWDIPDTPFEPERAVLLPEWVKAALAAEILQDTTMPEATQDFLSRQQGQ